MLDGLGDTSRKEEFSVIMREYAGKVITSKKNIYSIEELTCGSSLQNMIK